MKCTVIFLVLSMVVLMAEPGEGFWGALAHGAAKCAQGILGKNRNVEDQQEQLIKRGDDGDQMPDYTEEPGAR